MARKPRRFYRKEVHRAMERICERSGDTAGIDGVLPHELATQRPDTCHALLHPLNNDTYHFAPMHTVTKEVSGKRREIQIPTAQDRIVLSVCERRLQPTVRKRRPRSVMARPGGPNPKREMMKVIQAVKMGRWSHFATMDVRQAFPSLPPDYALSLLQTWCADPRALALQEKFLDSSWRGQPGVPLGAATSPLMLDVCMNAVDRALSGTGARVWRWVDDLLVAAEDLQTLELAVRVALRKLPAPLEFKPRAGPTEEVVFLGWGINTQTGSWRPTGGRLRRLQEVFAQVDETLPKRAQIWIHEHALGPMMLTDLLNVLPEWGQIDA